MSGLYDSKDGWICLCKELETRVERRYITEGKRRV